MSATKDKVIDDMNSNLLKVEVSIDCEPCSPRPDIYFHNVWTKVLGREEPVPEDNRGRRLFGAWFWERVEMTEDEYDAVLTYLRKLSDDGYIRGARLRKLHCYYFTFGCGIDDPHRNCFVVFEAYSWEEARDKMVIRFGTKWAFQYEEDEWIIDPKKSQMNKELCEIHGHFSDEPITQEKLYNLKLIK